MYVRDLERELVAVIESDASVATVSDAVADARRGLDRIERHVTDREEPVVAAVETTESDLDTVESELDRDRLPFTDRLREVAVDGRTDAARGTRELRRELRRVRDLLHDCEFDTARRDAEAVGEAADRLVVFVEFAGSVWSTVDSRGSGANVPRELSDGLVNVLAQAVERADEGVAVGHDADRLAFEYADVTPEPTADEETEPDPDPTADDETIAQPDTVVDEVLYVLRELSTAAERGDTFLQYSLDELPDSMANPDVLVNLRRFTERQTDLFDRVELQSPEPPGFLELTAAADTDVGEAVATARDRFRDRHT